MPSSTRGWRAELSDEYETCQTDSSTNSQLVLVLDAPPSIDYSRGWLQMSLPIKWLQVASRAMISSLKVDLAPVNVSRP